MLASSTYRVAVAVVLFVACAKTKDDGDAAAETTSSTSGSTSSTDGTTSTAAEDSTTRVPTTQADTSSESSAGADETCVQTRGGGTCRVACTEAADCCAEGTDERCPDEFPQNFECVDGGCMSPGCAGDADCETLGIPGLSCVNVLDVQYEFRGPVCQAPCENDDECGELLACTGMTEEGLSICVGEGAAHCECDAACDVFGGGACNPETGFCECTSDDECLEGFVCVPL